MWNSYDNYENCGLIILQLLLQRAIDISFLTGKDHANILQCLQQMTNYIPMLTGKDKIYYNVCNEGPNILQSLQQRSNYIPILTGKDQI
jgi:hypothetical protein